MTTLISMDLEKKIMHDLKAAMLEKNNLKLEVCRSIKSSILLAKTEKTIQVLTIQKEIEILQRMLKQRRESAKIYQEQGRLDLSKNEQDQAMLIEEYLPNQYTTEELEQVVDDIMKKLNLYSVQDMGQLMSAVISESKGRADGKTIASIVKKKLS